MLLDNVSMYRYIHGAFLNFRQLVRILSNQISSFHSNNFVWFFLISSNYEGIIFFYQQKIKHIDYKHKRLVMKITLLCYKNTWCIWWIWVYGNWKMLMNPKTISRYHLLPHLEWHGNKFWRVYYSYLHQNIGFRQSS